jgi:hypothetical protein
MGIRRRTAVVVSGLVFAGAAAVTVGAATPASADHHRSKDFQSVRVFNKNFNFSRSHSLQAQRQRGHQCNDRHHFDHHNNGDNGGGFAGLGFDGGFGGSCGFGGGGEGDGDGDD